MAELRFRHWRPRPQAVKRDARQVLDRDSHHYRRMLSEARCRWHARSHCQHVDCTPGIDLTYQSPDTQTHRKDKVSLVICRAGDQALGWRLTAGDETEVLWAILKATYILEHPAIRAIFNILSAIWYMPWTSALVYERGGAALRMFVLTI
jgi:hypothetical protein